VRFRVHMWALFLRKRVITPLIKSVVHRIGTWDC